VRARYETLTPRERQVMSGVIVGLLNKQIGYVLHSAERTVKTHRSRVMAKMKVRSVAELVRLAEELAAAGVRLEQVAWD
jgi:FixJ family two-component response regulator